MNEHGQGQIEVEESEARVLEEGLRVLAHIIAQAYLHDSGQRDSDRGEAPRVPEVTENCHFVVEEEGRE